MKHFLLSTGCFAFLLSGCGGVHDSKDKKNEPTIEEAEELDVIEVLPERDLTPQAATEAAIRAGNQTPATSVVRTVDADQEVIQAIRRALAGDALLARYVAIRVTTKNGEVVLRGFVDSVQDKAAVEKKIKSLSGVKQVDNQLEVTPMPADRR